MGLFKVKRVGFGFLSAKSRPLVELQKDWDLGFQDHGVPTQDLSWVVVQLRQH